MAVEEDGFLSRWSRRKQLARTGQPLPAAPAPVPAAPVATPAVAKAAPRTEEQTAAAPAPEQPPPPTMDDVAQLTPEADFSRFVARDVSPDVRNAAVKKLFADPHFNVMDGLDIYIDDYSKPSPLSAAEIAKMVGARFLKLVDDPEEQKTARAEASPAVAETVTPASADEPIPDSGTTAANPGAETAEPPATQDDHADLQLQPDHAPERESPGRGAG